MKVSKCGVMRDEKMVGDGDKDTDEHLTEECVGGGRGQVHACEAE